MTNDAWTNRQPHNQDGLILNKPEKIYLTSGTPPSFLDTDDELTECVAGLSHAQSLDGRHTAQSRVLLHKPYLFIMLKNKADLWYIISMATRGSIGFRHNGQDYLTYNHSDSYPSYLGAKMLELAKTLVTNPGLKWVRKMLDDIKCIEFTDSDQPEPTAEDIEALRKYTNTGVGEKSTSDWYCLTRGLQGELFEMLKCGYMLTNNNFIYNSLFCEWAYIINLDDEILEVYTGFNRGKPGKESRYEFDIEKCDDKNKPLSEQYYPCSIVAKFPLCSLPSEKKFLAILQPNDDEWIEEQFEAHFESSYANKVLAVIASKIGTTYTESLLNELKNAFTAGYELHKHND